MTRIERVNAHTCKALLVLLSLWRCDAIRVDDYEETMSLVLLQTSAQVVLGESNGRSTGMVSSQQAARSNGTTFHNSTVLSNASALSFDALANSRRLVALLHRGVLYQAQGLPNGSVIGIVIAVVVGSLLVVFLIYWRASYAIGNLFAAGLETWDQDVFGVDVTCNGDISVSPLLGIFNIHDFVMDNAPGYSAPYLMKLKHAKVDIDVWSYVISCGRNVFIEEIKCNGLEIIFEKSFSGSNVDYVKTHLEKWDEDHPDTPVGNGCAAGLLQCARDAARCRRAVRDLNEFADEKNHSLKVHRVKIQDVTTTLEAKGFPNHGVQMQLPDLYFDDLSAKAGTSIASMAKVVLQEVLHKTGNTASSKLFHPGQMLAGCGSRPPSSLYASGPPSSVLTASRPPSY